MIQHIFIQAAVYFSNLVVLNLRDFVMFEEPIPLLLFLKSYVTSKEKNFRVECDCSQIAFFVIEKK